MEDLLGGEREVTPFHTLAEHVHTRSTSSLSKLRAEVSLHFLIATVTSASLHSQYFQFHLLAQMRHNKANNTHVKWLPAHHVMSTPHPLSIHIFKGKLSLSSVCGFQFPFFLSEKLFWAHAIRGTVPLHFCLQKWKVMLPKQRQLSTPSTAAQQVQFDHSRNSEDTRYASPAASKCL